MKTPGDLSEEFDIGARLKSIREQFNLSQRALAKKANVTNGIISMIEKNRNSPSIATLKKILDTFPMSLVHFFNEDVIPRRQVVYRAQSLVKIESPGFSFHQVGTDPKSMTMQILHETIQPGADTGAEMLTHESEEGGIVLSGEIELTVAGQTYALGPNDAYYFDSRLPHRFRNAGNNAAELVSACTPPTI